MKESSTRDESLLRGERMGKTRWNEDAADSFGYGTNRTSCQLSFGQWIFWSNTWNWGFIDLNRTLLRFISDLGLFYYKMSRKYKTITTKTSWADHSHFTAVPIDQCHDLVNMYGFLCSLFICSRFLWFATAVWQPATPPRPFITFTFRPTILLESRFNVSYWDFLPAPGERLLHSNGIV